jgi:hypothetical protein
MKSESIIDTKLFVRHDLGVKATFTNERFTRDPSNLGHLANQLLLYESLIIPTKDFSIVPTLIYWMGYHDFVQAMESDAFEFIHIVGMLGYAGNGNGLVEIGLRESEEKKFDWWNKALFNPADEAIALQLQNIVEVVPRTEHKVVSELVLSKTSVNSYPNETFLEVIAEESYNDIIRSKRYSDYVTAYGQPTNNRCDLLRLQGIKGNQLRVLTSRGIKDPVDLLLTIAECNRDLYLATSRSDSDLVTSEETRFLLREKLERSGIPGDYERSFNSLLEFRGLPDITSALEKNLITMNEIWKIRKGPKARQFRNWLRVEGSRDPDRVRKYYVDSLERPSLAEHIPIKIVRFLVTLTLGLIPCAGTVANIADNFIVDKLLKGFRPNLFLDDLRQALGSPRHQ